MNGLVTNLTSNNIYLVVGPSGSGKTTVVTELCKRYNLTSVNSFTTRKRRFPGEQGHIFVSKPEFDELRPKLCAYTLFDGNEYGATHKQVNKSNFYVIDEAGIDYFISHYMGGKQPIVIYIDATQETLEKRMAARGDSAANISNRIKADNTRKRKEYRLPTFYVVNDDLEQTVEVIHNFMTLREGWC